MLHAPGPLQAMQQSWKVLQNLHRQGKIKHLGVSNFPVERLSELLSLGEPYPSVVQNKFDLYHRGAQVLVNSSNARRISELGLILDAYSPLSGWPYDASPVDDPHVAAIAAEAGIPAGQVLVRWMLEQGLGVIVSSTNKTHLMAAAAAQHTRLANAHSEHLTFAVRDLIRSPLHT